METKVTYLSEIIEAITHYEGVATLKEINEYILNRNMLSAIKTNPNWEKNVSATIQRHSSDSSSYNGSSDIFYSVYGLYEGCWGLRSFINMTDSNYINPLENRIVNRIKTDISLTSTEVEMLLKARVGQGSFREKLINKYKKCIITGIENKTLLFASHIKPWRISNNQERLSSENGLLLSPLYDKLFDKGFITFNKEGYMILSDKLGKDKYRIDFDEHIKYIVNPSIELKNNLQYHNDVIFNI